MNQTGRIVSDPPTTFRNADYRSTDIACAFHGNANPGKYLAAIWRSWIDGEGAYFYVCGDARRMAKDVDAALRKIVEEQGGKGVQGASEYVEKLKSDKRYKRDVY